MFWFGDYTSCVRCHNAIVVVTFLSLVTARAGAQNENPLLRCVRAAEQHALDAREAREVLAQTRSQADEARARLLPSFAAAGSYTRNEIEVAVQIPRGTEVVRSVITPYDQWDARFTLSVPIFDIGAWANFHSAEATADSARYREQNAHIEVSLAAVTAYAQRRAAHRLVAAAQRSLVVANEVARVTQVRVAAGLRTALDGARATSDAARAEELLVQAELALALAELQMQNLTGTTLETADDGFALRGVGEHADEWQRDAESPLEGAERLAVRAAELQNDAAWEAFLPTLAGTAAERVTNAVGFGPNSQWSLALSLTWNLDFLRPAAVSTRHHQLEIARLRHERVQQQLHTQIVDAFFRSRAAERSLAASIRNREALAEAARLAHSRLDAGTGTHTDASQADRDLFSAEASAIQSEGNLWVAVAALYLRTGRPLEQMFASTGVAQ